MIELMIPPNLYLIDNLKKFITLDKKQFEFDLAN